MRNPQNKHLKICRQLSKEKTPLQEFKYPRKTNPRGQLSTSASHLTSQRKQLQNLMNNAPTPKHMVPCPFLCKNGKCLKGPNCDFSHGFSQYQSPPAYKRPSTKQLLNPMNHAPTPKHMVPCPFLRRNGKCLKGSNCDFSHGSLPVLLPPSI